MGSSVVGVSDQLFDEIVSLDVGFTLDGTHASLGQLFNILFLN